MTTKWIVIALIILGFLTGCKRDSEPATEKAIPIGEGTFVYKERVYKLLNNEVLQIGDLKSTAIRKFEISTPKLKYLGRATIDFVKKEASVDVNSVYRGNYLYFMLRFDGINDLRDNYLPGSFTVEFLDEFGFMIYSVNIPTSDIIRTVGADGTTDHFEYNGKIELSIEAETAISRCSMESTVRRK
jgi:hypothetical protein